MTITEASKVNVLLDWILGPDRGAVGCYTPIDQSDVQEAAEYLAERAYKALYAGVTPKDVAERGVRQKGRTP